MSAPAADPVLLLAADLLDPSGAVQHPSAWVRERGEVPWSKQDAIFDSVYRHRRTAVRACFDVGKSFAASRIAAWWIDQHPPGSAFVVSTAPTASQVRAILWREIRSIHRSARLPGRVNQTEWWLADDGLHRTTPRWDEQMVGMGRKPGEYDTSSFQGIHARYVLVLIDEASGIPPSLWDAAEGLLANADCRVLAIGNPETADSHFADVCAPGSGWNVIHISAFDSPNFTDERHVLPDEVLANLVSPVWVEERRKDWGEGDPRWDAKVLGLFPQVGEHNLFQTDWLAASVERWKARADRSPEGKPVLGVDVARFGSARNVVAARWGRRIDLVEEWAQARTTESTGRVVNLLASLGAASAHVDGVGVGGGVVDGLVEQGAPVEDMQAGAAASDPDRYVNARSEWYWNLRTALQRDEVDLPESSALWKQAVSVRWAVDSRGRIRVETKEEMAKRGVPSPDHLDAVVLALAEPVSYRPIPAVPSGDTQSNEFRT